MLILNLFKHLVVHFINFVLKFRVWDDGSVLIFGVEYFPLDSYIDMVCSLAG